MKFSVKYFLKFRLPTHLVRINEFTRFYQEIITNVSNPFVTNGHFYKCYTYAVNSKNISPIKYILNKKAFQ